jgi:hypothetical protein
MFLWECLNTRKSKSVFMKDLWLFSVIASIGLFSLIVFGHPSVTGNAVKQTIEYCIDSDGGKYYEAGKLTAYNYIELKKAYENIIEQDYCDGNTLVEWFCEGEKAGFIPMECQNGCSLGRCL